jgi:heterodisulfide reductase subunit A
MGEARMSILVIGGGIAGIQASLDLADQGIKVFLVEKTPSIGGVMAQLDKTFPTNDCSICIEAPKMAEVARHPNIILLTNSEVKKVDQTDNGKYKVKIEKKPRYVDEQKCKACGACAEACLLKAKIPNEFDLGLSKRSAIYIPFPQAIPLKYVIDPDHCIFIKRGKCGDFPSCKKACPNDAIDFEQKKKEIEIEVSGIIAAPGFELFQPLGIYGYGVYDNVITSMQFERLVNAAGPTKGKIVRLSDGEKPKSIAWIQCVGSRDKRYKSYCSQICCMYATKEALIAKEHDSEIEAYIFYIDLKAVEKGFEEYYKRAKMNGVNYIRAKPAEVVEDLDKGLILSYEDTESGELKKLKVDLLVLSPAILPPKSNVELAKTLGIELDEKGRN